MTTLQDGGLSDISIQSWADDYLNSHILGYFVYGFYTGLFGMTIWQLLTVKKTSKARIYMGCIVTALYMFSMIYAITRWIVLSRANFFVTSSRARYSYELTGSPSLKVLAIMSTTASALNLNIADCTIIWRCWVVWAHDYKVIILPIFFVIGEIVCGANSVVSEFMAEGETQTNWALSLMATTLGTNILCTALIIARILYLARGNRGIMGGIRTYRGVLEIVVESAALYSITLVVLMVLYPIEGGGYMYPQVLNIPFTGIAPTLIVLRVASGQGRPKESSLETQSSLHFQTSRGSTIETVTDGGEEDTMQGNTGGIAPVPSGSVEQV